MKQLIASPISHLFENEIHGNEISLVSDCLEVRERSYKSSRKKIWLFHIDIDITHPWDQKVKSYIKTILKNKPELKLITFQSTRCCQGEVLDKGIFQLSGEVFTKDQMISFAMKNSCWLRENFPKQLLIGLENNNYYPTSAYDIITEGGFISEVVEKCELYFLLDIAHAMVTAHNLDIDYKDYLNSLPMDRLLQLHICQPILPNNGMGYDAHEAPNQEMYQEVKRLVNLYPNIKYLTIEYYRDKDILINSIKFLRKVLDNEK